MLPSSLVLLLALVMSVRGEIATEPAVTTPDCSRQADPKICHLDTTALEIFRRLHAQLDDDKDGSIDAAEFDDFAREELKQVHSFEQPSARAAATEGGDVSAIWRQWLASEAHNWTLKEVSAWLSSHANLNQLSHLAWELQIDGPYLPLLAEPSWKHLLAVAPRFARAVSPAQRRRLALLATNLILFGPPTKLHNPLKDFALACLLVLSIGGGLFALTQKRFADDHIGKVIEELAVLQLRVNSVGDLQERLNNAEQQCEYDRAERLRLEESYQREVSVLKEEAARLAAQRESTVEELASAERKLTQLRGRPASPESATATTELRSLLQAAHEADLRYCRQRKAEAERRLAEISEKLERLRRKQGSFVGVLRSTLRSADLLYSLEPKIAATKEFSDEVKQENTLCTRRWQRIAEVLGAGGWQQAGSDPHGSRGNVRSACSPASDGAWELGSPSPGPSDQPEKRRAIRAAFYGDNSCSSSSGALDRDLAAAAADATAAVLFHLPADADSGAGPCPDSAPDSDAMSQSQSDVESAAAPSEPRQRRVAAKSGGGAFKFGTFRKKFQEK